MHSRIFQITKEKLPKSEWISSNDYYDHWFTNRIADYVDDDVNRDSDLDWFFSVMEGVVRRDEKNGNKFKVIDKLEYFRTRHEEFIHALNELQSITIRQLAGEEPIKPCGLSYLKYKLDSAYNDEYSFYVDDNHEWAGLDTLDEFMRRVHDGDEFYIGGVVDYHS